MMVEPAWTVQLRRFFATLLGRDPGSFPGVEYVCYFEPYVDEMTVSGMLENCPFDAWADEGHYVVVREDLVEELQWLVETDEEFEAMRRRFAASDHRFDEPIPLEDYCEIFGGSTVPALPFLLRVRTDGTLFDALRSAVLVPDGEDAEGWMDATLDRIDPRCADALAAVEDDRLRAHLSNWCEEQGRGGARVVFACEPVPGELGLLVEARDLEFVLGWLNTEFGLGTAVFAIGGG